MSNLRATLVRFLLAFGFSFAIWAFVSFSQNPEARVTFPDVPLEAVGLEEGLVLVDANGLPSLALPAVDITLSTDQQQLAQLRPVDVRAVADLSERGPGEHFVLINVQPTRSNLSFTVPEGGVEPAGVPIRLEAVSTRVVPINLEVIGNLPFSFERGEPAMTSGGRPISTVEIEGPQSRVERVQAVRAMANIEQLRATYLAPLTLAPVDAGGVEVEGLRVTPSTVTVEIPINPVVGLKLVPVQPTIRGQPAPGYAVTGVIVEPPLIALVGRSGPLDAVAALATDPVDLTGATATLVRAVGFTAPANTSPDEGEPDTVRVTVQIAPIVLPFQVTLPLPVGLTGLSPGLQVSLNPQVITATLRGSSDSLAALGQAQLRATVDVSSLGPGVYQLPATLDLPQGVSLSGDSPTVQVTLRSPPPPAPTVTTTATEGTPEPTDTPERPTATPDPPFATPTPPEATATPAEATAIPPVEPTIPTPEPPTPSPMP